MSRVAYLGPRGTFAEEALSTQADLVAMETVPMGSVPLVIAAAESGEVDLGLVPLENSIEGSVHATIDTLAFETDLLIQRELDLKVSLDLGVSEGTDLSDISVVVSHPNPLGQCRHWLEQNLPNAETRTANSTAEAARQIVHSPHGSDAAIANSRALERYGLVALVRGIQDFPSQTRFVVLGRGIPAPSGLDKTSVVCTQRVDRPGSLLAILQEFAARSINLTKVESRPTKAHLGEYCFFIDCEGHVGDDVVADCLRVIQTRHADVKFLGSYPMALADEPRVGDATVDPAAASASAWIDDLRSRIRGGAALA